MLRILIVKIIYNTYQIWAFNLIWKLSKKNTNFANNFSRFSVFAPLQSCARGGRPSRPTLATAVDRKPLHFTG